MNHEKQNTEIINQMDLNRITSETQLKLKKSMNYLWFVFFLAAGVLACAAILLGINLLSLNSDFEPFGILIAVIVMVFFSYALLIIWRMIHDNRLGLQLDRSGLIHTSNLLYNEQIKWEHILGFKRIIYKGQVYIAVLLVENHPCWEKTRSKRFWQKLNGWFFKSPVIITTSVLDLEPLGDTELLAALEKFYQFFKR